MYFEEKNKTMGDLLRENIQKEPRWGDTFKLKPEEGKEAIVWVLGEKCPYRPECSNTEVGKAFVFGSMPGTMLSQSFCNGWGVWIWRPRKTSRKLKEIYWSFQKNKA